MPTFYFDNNLHDIPLDPEALTKECQELAEKIPYQQDPLTKIKLLGKRGGFLRTLRRLEEAEEDLELACQLAQENNFPAQIISNSLRLAHTWQWQKKFSQAQQLFEEILQTCQEQNQQKYLDFAHQHYGKCLFDQKQYSQALEQFLHAKKLRQQKQDPELLFSTEKAIEETRKRMRKIS